MPDLTAQRFLADERVTQAKRLIQEALADHQRRLTGVRPPSDDLADPYQRMLESFGAMRGGALIWPYLGSGFGNGALVELADGSVKYDFITGIGVHAWGHSHPDIVAAAIDAALSDTIMQGNLQQNVRSVELVKLLLDAANGADNPAADNAPTSGCRLEHCLLTTSGAMANENALKILFQHKAPADRLIAFEHCFMGRTLVLAQLTDKPAYRDGLPTTIAVDYVPFFDPDDPEGSTRRALDTLRSHLARHPGRHAAMCFELVQGEGGYYPGDRAFFEALMNELREHEVPVMVDEIQTFGRTSRLFAYQHFGLDEYVDVVTIGKLSQVCATLFTDAVKPRPGLLSQTFTGGTAAICASKTIIAGLLGGGYYGPSGRIARLNRHFTQRLSNLAETRPDAVRGPFGIGVMIAFTAFGGDVDATKALIKALFDAGVLAFVAGSNPTRTRFLVPIGAVTEQDIDAVCGILETTIDQVAGSL